MPAAEPIAALHGRVLTNGLDLGLARIEILHGRIATIMPGAAPEPGDFLVRAGWITPGLIDVQVNGAEGIDLTSDPAPAAAVAQVARAVAAHGVTAFCPTLVSGRPDAIHDRLAAFAPRAHAAGAASLGTHLEGPFISHAYRGVHAAVDLRTPDLAEIDAWLASAPPAMVTLAPELPGALAAIRVLVAAGVLVSLGHSGADVAAARAGLAAGARMGTHLFNAMPPLHHRRPGLVGALLASSDAVLGLIADGVHVDPILVDLVVRAATPDRVALVSDALAAAASAPGPSRLGDQAVISDGQTVRRADGTLAGSALLLDGCLRRVIDWLPWLPPARAVQMATEVPARVLGGGVAARKGRLAPGYDADLAVFDTDWRIQATIVRGCLIAPPQTAAA